LWVKQNLLNNELSCDHLNMDNYVKETSNQLVGKNIKSLRRKRKWTQKYVADSIGVSIPTISKIETGITDINLSRIYQIANVCGVDISQLFIDNIEDFEPVPVSLDLSIPNVRTIYDDAEIFNLRRKIIELHGELQQYKNQKLAHVQ
jgi:transcriptional regulator with XRE-family HTH domain